MLLLLSLKVLGSSNSSGKLLTGKQAADLKLQLATGRATHHKLRLVGSNPTSKQLTMPNPLTHRIKEHSTTSSSAKVGRRNKPEMQILWLNSSDSS